MWRGRPRPRAIMASYHLCNRAQLHPTPLLMLSLLFTHCTPHRLSVASVSLGFCIIGSIYLARQHMVYLFMSVFLPSIMYHNLRFNTLAVNILTFFYTILLRLQSHLGIAVACAFDVVFILLMFDCRACVCVSERE